MAAPTRPVTEIQIGGHTYRVQSSADTAELARLVAIVEARLAELPSARRHDSRSLVLVALSLAHDLSKLELEHAGLRSLVVKRLTALVGKVDQALDNRDQNGELLPPLPELHAHESESGPALAPLTATPPTVSPPPLVASDLGGVAPPVPASVKAPAKRRGRAPGLRSDANES